MKLINWNEIPRLTMTNEGEFLSVQESGYAQVLFTLQARSKDCCIANIALTHLRLAPAEQQPWLVYEEGVTVIPEWAEFSFKVKDYKRTFLGHSQIDADLYTESFTDRVISDNTVYLTGQPFAYKIIGIKEGWTDNPNEVIE